MNIEDLKCCGNCCKGSYDKYSNILECEILGIKVRPDERCQSNHWCFDDVEWDMRTRNVDMMRGEKWRKINDN